MENGKLKLGCPKGSSLSPVLWNFYQNDLFNENVLSQLSAYADDHQIYITGEKIGNVVSSLEEDGNTTGRWYKSNYLSAVIHYPYTTSSPPFYPFVLRDSRASETLARVKITPREKRRHAACRLFSIGVIFTRACVSLALLSLRKNGGLLVAYITLGARDFSSAFSGFCQVFSRGFGLRPKMCRPSANTENSRRTREKPLIPSVVIHRKSSTGYIKSQARS